MGSPLCHVPSCERVMSYDPKWNSNTSEAEKILDITTTNPSHYRCEVHGRSLKDVYSNQK